MRRYLIFLGAGTFFSTVEEFATIVILKHDVPSYLMTLVILFPAFLTIVFFSGRLIDRVLFDTPWCEVTHFVVYATTGLMIEWFAIGLSPWSNPTANAVVMFLFQLGMFSFWGTVAVAPRLFLRSDDHSVKTRRSILRLYIPYFLIVYLVALTAPVQIRFPATIILIIVGYYAVVIRLLLSFRSTTPEANPCVNSSEAGSGRWES